MLDPHMEATLAAWRDALRRSGVSSRARRELEDHLLTAVEYAIEAGSSPADAFAKAQQDLGDPGQLATEFTKEQAMHPITKFFGLALALLAIITVVDVEGGATIWLLALPPLAMISFVTLGGLFASCGPRRVLRAFAVGIAAAQVEPDEIDSLRAVCTRGHRLAYVAGGLQVVLGTMQVLCALGSPAEIGPSLAYTMIGLVQAVVIADLGFGTLSSWIAARGPQPLTP